MEDIIKIHMMNSNPGSHLSSPWPYLSTETESGEALHMFWPSLLSPSYWKILIVYTLFPRKSLAIAIVVSLLKYVGV